MDVRRIAIGAVLALCFAAPALADYFEVRRSANVYSEADRTSQIVQHFDPDTVASQITLAVVPGALVNGYVHVTLPSGEEGWIYKSRGRLFPGVAPGTAPVSGGGTGEETDPDTTGLVPSTGIDPALAPVTNPGLQIYMFSIGQADSLLVVGPPPARKTLLVDVGEEVQGGTQRNYVHVRDRIKQITSQDSVNYFVLTHYHKDHGGTPGRGTCTGRNAALLGSGVFALLNDQQRSFRIDTWIDRGDNGEEYTPKMSQAHCGVIASMDGWKSGGRVGNRHSAAIGKSQINLGPGVTVEIVASDGKVAVNDLGAMAHAVQQHGSVYSASHQASQNDYSVAMEISLGDFEMFLGGDLTGSDANGTGETHSVQPHGGVYTNVESYMVRQWRQPQTLRESAVEIYRANHHGSEHSSNPDLAGALQPLVVLYSAGGDYGHPKPSVVRRFRGKDQFVTTSVASNSWPQGLPPDLGSVVGEIQIAVASDGSRFQVNDHVYRSRTDAQEAAP